MTCVGVPGTSVAGYGKSVLDSSDQTHTWGVQNQNVPVGSRGIQVLHSRKEQLPRWHAAATGKLWDLFIAVSGMWLQRSAKAIYSALLTP